MRKAIWTSILLMAAVGTGSAQKPAAGCTLVKHVYTCHWEAFRQMLDESKTVNVPVTRMERFTAVQLQGLVKDLGKEVSGPEKADLIFQVEAVDTEGISIGSADRALARLLIYRGGPERKLVWAETYTGQEDRPWASTVRAVIDQFQARFAAK